jgi:hypothetical protein
MSVRMRGRSSAHRGLVGDGASVRFTACLGGGGRRFAAAGRFTAPSRVSAGRKPESGASSSSTIAARNTVVWRPRSATLSNKPKTWCNTAASAASMKDSEDLVQRSR